MNNRRWIYFGLPVIGTVFCLIYIHLSTVNVVYSDYIRLINSYLPDVWDPKKFFVPDVLTRIPINYLGRIINVEIFGLNLQADRIAGVLGLGLSAFLLAVYSAKRQLSAGWFAILMAVVFSLNKWEMLVNGSGWAHFLAFALFYYNFMVLDRVRCGGEKSGDRVRLAVLPFVITLGVAGPYCAIYTATLLLAYGCFWIMDAAAGRRGKSPVREEAAEFPGEDKGAAPVRPCPHSHPLRFWVILAVCAAIPLLLYMWSNSTLTEDYDRNSVSASLLPSMAAEPKFFAKFFLKSFASMVLGGEVITEKLHLTGTEASLIGLLVIFAYLLALGLNLYLKLWRESVFPLLCLAAGGMNHLLIMISRWIFENEDYGMSSRYALQFQIGIVGIILTFALAKRHLAGRRASILRAAVLACGLIFLAGNLYTTAAELEKAKYRKARGCEQAEAVLHYKELDDETLSSVIEYSRGADKIRRALGIIEENHLNVFQHMEERER